MHATQNQVTVLVTPAHTLRDAANYLARHGWIQGCYYDPTATVFTPCACVVGAIGMVCYGGPVDAPAQHFDEPGFEDFSAAYAMLLWHLVVTQGADCDPYTFNDAKGRTAGEVIDALHGAADRWDSIYRNEANLNGLAAHVANTAAAVSSCHTMAGAA